MKPLQGTAPEKEKETNVGLGRMGGVEDVQQGDVGAEKQLYSL